MRSRTSLASAPTSSRFLCSKSATPSSRVSGSPSLILSRIRFISRHFLYRIADAPFRDGEARAADERHGLFTRQGGVVGVVAEAQRALAHDGREELVGAEA